jgi:hypothetical protein
LTFSPLTPADARQFERRISDRLDAQERRKRNGEAAPDEGTYAKIGSRVYRDRRIKAAMPFISIIVQWAVRKGGWTDEYQPHVAKKLGVTDRTVRRWQRIADEAEMIKTETRRGRGRRNRYTVLPAALPPPSERPRARVAQQNKSDRNVRSTRTESEPKGSVSASPPNPLPASGKGEAVGARRAEPVPARERALPPPPRAPATPQAARQVASATKTEPGRGEPRPRAPP